MEETTQLAGVQQTASELSDGIMEGLSSLSAFRFFPKLLQMTLQRAEIRTAPADLTFIEEGDSAEFIFMSLNFSLKRSMKLGHLNESIYASNVDPYEFIGFTEVTERKNFFINYAALEETKLLTLSRVDIHAIFNDPLDLSRFRKLNSSRAIRSFIFTLMDKKIDRSALEEIIDKIEDTPLMLEKREAFSRTDSLLYLIQSGVVAGARQWQGEMQNVYFQPGSCLSSVYIQRSEFSSLPIRAVETVFYHALPLSLLEEKTPKDFLEAMHAEPTLAIQPAEFNNRAGAAFAEVDARSISLKKLENFGFSGNIKDIRFGGHSLSPYNSTLWNFLVLFGEDLNESYISKLGAVQESINLSQFASALEDVGFVTNLRRFYGTEPEEIPQRCLIFFLGRPVIFLQGQLSKIFLLDPVYGMIVVERNKFFPNWNRNLIDVKRSVILEVVPKETKTGIEKAEQVGKKILNFFLGRMSVEFRNLLTFQIFQSLAVVAVPTFLYGLVNQAVGKTHVGVLYGYYIGLSLFILFQAISAFALNIYTSQILGQIKTQAQNYFYKLFLNAVSSPLQPLRGGTVATRMSLIEYSMTALKFQKSELIVSLFSLSLFLLIVANFSIQAALIVGLFIILAFATVYFLRKKGGFTEVNTALLRQDSMDSFVDIVQGFRSIQSTQTMKAAETKINTVVNQLAKGSGQYSGGLIAITQKGLILFKVGGILGLYFLFNEMINRRAEPAAVFGLTLYLSYLYAPFKSILNYFTNYNTLGLFATSGQLALAQNLQKSKTQIMVRLRGALQFERVSFRYNDKLQFTLNEISFKIQPGERIAIVGRSGSGKSTLAKLIARHFESSSGKISFDDVDSRLIEPSSVQSEVGFVPQVPTLFAGSIAYNICFSEEESMLKKTRQICQATNAHSFIKNLPGNYSYRVKEFGVGLSLGQKQILALTRVLLLDPKILVLDEATAHLDPESEAHIIDQIYERKQFRTTIMIVQKISTARRADRIFVLKEGRIIEEGDHNRLLALGGEYSELYRNQVSDD